MVIHAAGDTSLPDGCTRGYANDARRAQAASARASARAFTITGPSPVIYIAPSPDGTLSFTPGGTRSKPDPAFVASRTTIGNLGGLCGPNAVVGSLFNVSVALVNDTAGNAGHASAASSLPDLDRGSDCHPAECAVAADAGPPMPSPVPMQCRSEPAGPVQARVTA